MPRAVVICHLPRSQKYYDNHKENLSKYLDARENRMDKKTMNSATIPPSSIQIRQMDNMVLINGRVASAIRYEIIVPNKVMRVTFADGSQEKVVCHHLDIFDVDTGIRVAIAKHVGKEYYNESGIENLAERLSYLKCIDKMIARLHSQYRAEEKCKEKEAVAAYEAKLQAQRKAKKQEEKRKKKAAARSELTSDHAPNTSDTSIVSTNRVNITKRRHNPGDRSSKNR